MVATLFRLMNLILIANNFPPVIIRTEEKDVYSKYIAHAQQYEENPIPLYEILGNLLIAQQKEIIDFINAKDFKSIDNQ